MDSWSFKIWATFVGSQQYFEFKLWINAKTLNTLTKTFLENKFGGKTKNWLYNDN